MVVSGEYMLIQASTLKLVLVAVASGFFAALGTGMISSASGIGIPEMKLYGYPLPWIVTDLNGPTQYVLTNLALNIVFWAAVLSISLVSLQKIMFPALGIEVDRKRILLMTLLFIPLGFAMTFAHETGHAALASAVGGELKYMKITYLEVYPRLAVTPEFQLGLTEVAGLTYGSVEYGLMLLGGSTTTNIASWITGLVLLVTSLGGKAEFILKLLGFFGILDLPFYVVFPQIGLRHWIFIGGESGPEPLIGARMVGIPDAAFYLMVGVLTLGLLLLYSKTLRTTVLSISPLRRL